MTLLIIALGQCLKLFGHSLPPIQGQSETCKDNLHFLLKNCFHPGLLIKDITSDNSVISYLIMSFYDPF